MTSERDSNDRRKVRGCFPKELPKWWMLISNISGFMDSSKYISIDFCFLCSTHQEMAMVKELASKYPKN